MSNEDDYKTTEDDFEYYKQQCRYFIILFGLVDYEVFFDWDEDDEMRGRCRVNTQGKICTILLSKDWGWTKPTRELLRRCAFHEVCELLTAEFEVTARLGYELSPAGREEYLERVRHALIRRLENCVLPHLPS